jgi:uncharacterized protein YceH (UPF0502 family)
MASEPVPTQTPAYQYPVLSLTERRVLGVLVEKAKTTPDIYPLSVNALLTGCNQKSNRDPILNLSEEDVEDSLGAVQKKGLVNKITGGRVERWRHLLYEAWRADKVELAVLAELLLRGPQTEGELRTRASRMEPIDDLDALRKILRPLVERKLVVYLTPEGRRGTMLTHGFHAADELARLRQTCSAQSSEKDTSPPTSSALRPSSPAPVSSVLEERLSAAEAELTALRTLVSELRESVAALTADLRHLERSLGS